MIVLSAGIASPPYLAVAALLDSKFQGSSRQLMLVEWIFDPPTPFIISRLTGFVRRATSSGLWRTVGTSPLTLAAPRWLRPNCWISSKT
ncbi:MAG: hypothetical protein BGO11_19455 [Solirubrobacterales bacterium 70-9]|nr:MAG: hypothetical protein BGO11_19455 [Solirubrobacterales bacterium 70-9]